MFADIATQDWTDEPKRLLVTYAVPLAGKVVGAILIWIVGRAIISAARRGVTTNLEKRHVDSMLVRYVASMLGIVGTLLILLTMLSVFGVETASFAGIIAATGVAIGMAWSGLLSSFAAGVFMVVLRPFKVGDMITGGGVTGVVHEVGLFATTLDTGDNVRIFVANAKIFGDTIHNYTVNPHRRVDLKAQLAHGVDPVDAIRRITARVARIPHVLASPPVSVEVLEFNLAGPVLAVRPSCHNDHYWDVYFATNMALQQEFTEAGYPTPDQHLRIIDGASLRAPKPLVSAAVA